METLNASFDTEMIEQVYFSENGLTEYSENSLTEYMTNVPLEDYCNMKFWSQHDEQSVTYSC